MGDERAMCGLGAGDERMLSWLWADEQNISELLSLTFGQSLSFLDTLNAMHKQLESDIITSVFTKVSVNTGKRGGRGVNSEQFPIT